MHAATSAWGVMYSFLRRPFTPALNVDETLSFLASASCLSSSPISSCTAAIVLSTLVRSRVAIASPSRSFVLAVTTTSSISTPSGTVTVSVSTSSIFPEPLTRVLMLP